MIKKLFGQLLRIKSWVYRRVSRISLFITRTCRFPQSRNIVFVCNCELMAEFMANIWNMLKNDKRLHFYLYESIRVKRVGGIEYIRKFLPIPHTSKKRTELRHTDLVIVADFVSEKIVDKQYNPTIRIQHGIEGGKIIEGEYYNFGKGILDKHGNVRFSRIFVSSHAIAEIGLKSNPALGDVIAVTGNLHCDKLLSMESKRGQYRDRFGFKPDDIVVMVISTWGPYCLFNTVGKAVLDQTRNLMDKYRFILNVHPHEYREKPPGQRVWGEYLRQQKKYGYWLADASEDWMPYMVASDIIVSDQTSLSLFGVILDRPIITVPIPDEQLTKGALLWRLREFSPTIKPDASDLRDRLIEAMENYPHDKLRELAKDINSYPGQAAKRAKREIYKILNIPAK